MSKYKRFILTLYLGVISLVTISYLLMILIGSIQGNDMKGAALDADNTNHSKFIDSRNDRADTPEPHANEIHLFNSKSNMLPSTLHIITPATLNNKQ
ncbi:hypothetical protein [Staphylococcus auricularis]|uniref:Secreted protein n=1 Tax=Staphylococcus auricularis TaxID=29379 RepID=A0ABX5IIF7_9STAP|nr:hypothetical protein [Staphylococcus auricularis]MCE5038825.1 hypothetical protein [Staphylococcus auricularis]MEB6570627.1 hypothetical protein [Staphylococcus auricularis]PTH18882.1 hypothetical protein BU607_03470 [Staphylococcus auricularis]